MDPYWKLIWNILINYTNSIMIIHSNIANKYGKKTGGVNKLVPNLGYKSKNVLHYKNL